MAAQLTLQRVADGTYLFHAGQQADKLYVLSEGELEVVRTQADGSEVLLNTLGSASVFGELAILRGETRSAGVRARGAVLVYWLDAMTFLHDVRRWPELALAIARGVADSFVRAETRMARAPLWVVPSFAKLGPGFPV